MKAKDFPERNLLIAEDQSEYETLPAFVDPEEGTVTFCFELDEEEKKRVQETGEITMKVLTFNRALQPIAMSTIREELINSKGDLHSIRADINVTAEGLLLDIPEGKNAAIKQIDGKLQVRFVDQEKEASNG